MLYILVIFSRLWDLVGSRTPSKQSWGCRWSCRWGCIDLYGVVDAVAKFLLRHTEFVNMKSCMVCPFLSYLHQHYVKISLCYWVAIVVSIISIITQCLVVQQVTLQRIRKSEPRHPAEQMCVPIQLQQMISDRLST